MSGEIQCSEEHASIERDEEQKLKSVILCRENPETKRLKNVITNAITIVLCENHKKQEHPIPENFCQYGDV